MSTKSLVKRCRDVAADSALVTYASPAQVTLMAAADSLEQWDESRDSLSRREYFAAKALQGIVADPHNGVANAADVAKWAVQCADALIAELAI